MDGVEVFGLQAVVADLENAPVRLIANLRLAVQINCKKVRDDARQRVMGHRYLPAYPYSITYETAYGPDSVEGVIGPDKGRAQGPLGNIIEYGTSKNAPLPHLGPALDANADDLVAGVEIAVRQALA